MIKNITPPPAARWALRLLVCLGLTAFFAGCKMSSTGIGDSEIAEAPFFVPLIDQQAYLGVIGNLSSDACNASAVIKMEFKDAADASIYQEVGELTNGILTINLPEMLPSNSVLKTKDSVSGGYSIAPDDTEWEIVEGFRLFDQAGTEIGVLLFCNPEEISAAFIFSKNGPFTISATENGQQVEFPFRQGWNCYPIQHGAGISQDFSALQNGKWYTDISTSP